MKYRKIAEVRSPADDVASDALARSSRQQKRPSTPDSIESLMREQKRMLAAYEACWNGCPGTVTPENFACEDRCRSKMPELDAMQDRINKMLDKQ
jgi:hypothetical protein